MDEKARKSVEALVETLREGWNRHDAKLFASAFAKDADFTNVFGIVAKGRGAVEASHAVIFRTIFKDSHWGKAEPKVRFLRPDVAAVDVRWEVTGSLDMDRRPARLRHGLMNFIAIAENGVWKIAVFHNKDLPPPERMQAAARLWED